jgi:hypothetical protein
MPRYFFNVHDVEPSTDDHGEELLDDEAAWREATYFAGGVLKDIDGKFRPGQCWSIEVMNEAGRAIYCLRIEAKKLK